MDIGSLLVTGRQHEGSSSSSSAKFHQFISLEAIALLSFPFPLMFPFFWMRWPRPSYRPFTLSYQEWLNRSSAFFVQLPLWVKTHNSVEQKFVVKTPSCATNVSDHSSMYRLVFAFVSSVLRLDFVLESKLFLRLSCALAPTFKTTFCPIPSDSRSVSSFSLGLIFESILLTEEVDEAELLLLWHGESSLWKLVSSLACRSVESPFEHGKQTLRKSGLCARILAVITYDITRTCFETLSLPNYCL